MEKDYEHLINKPSINYIELVGNLTQEDLQLTAVHDTAYWGEHQYYMPLAGQIIVYTDKDIINGVVYPGIKIGDGRHYVKDLEFIGDDLAKGIVEVLEAHILDEERHITSEERNTWNTHVGCTVEGESLVFHGFDVNE